MWDSNLAGASTSTCKFPDNIALLIAVAAADFATLTEETRSLLLPWNFLDQNFLKSKGNS